MQKKESEISLPDIVQKKIEWSVIQPDNTALPFRTQIYPAGEFEASEKGKINFFPKKNVQYNDKYKKKKMGIYQQTTLEKAKDILTNNLYDIAELIKQGILDKLTPEEQKKIKKFITNFRQKGKAGFSENSKIIESKLNITKEQQNTISNVQVSRNELISKELCASQNFEIQVAVMLDNNRQNHLAIFDFLKSLQQEPFEKFFEVLIEVIQAVADCTQQVRLLIGLFGIYNGQKLNPRSDLCCLALKYLANEDGVTSQQVIGFLKFAFITNGDLHKAELSDLVQFDKRHKQCFVGFKQWLTMIFRLPHDLTLVIPNSCYILGLPFAKMLKNKSNILTEHIPSDFLALFIQTLVFSFEEDEELFLGFLNVAKNGFLKFIEKIKTTQLLNLFSGLLDEVQQHNKLWYLNISNSRRLIEGALVLVKENKVRTFDYEVCQNLLSEVTNVDQYLIAPSFIKSDTSQANERQCKDLFALNKKSRVARKFLYAFDMNKTLSEKIINNFQALKITPHFIQELAMKIICQKDCVYSFLNIAPGLGKTKLILAVAIDLVQTTKFPVFVLNSSKTLCNRDFQEATISLEELQISCASVLSQKCMINFSLAQDFVEYKEDLPEKYHVLLDEYHNIFFREDKFKGFVDKLKICETFIGFSGSPLNFAQYKLLQNCFEKRTLVLQLTPHTDLGNQETIICKTQSLLIKELSCISQKFRLKAPQVFILDTQTATALTKSKKKQPYISLFDKDAPFINNTLSKMFNKPDDNGEYGTYIINEEMGTGTDFKTSSDIENKGGLVLVFGIKPTNTSTFEQLSCRVGRIFNKSQRFYVIHDATYFGPSDQYLKFQLEILKQKESEEARALLSVLKPDINNSIEVSDESEDDKQLENSTPVGENNEDIEMEDDTSDQNSHNETLNSVDENNKSFDHKQLDVGLRKLKQTQEKDEVVKKRKLKRQGKFNLKQNKAVQQVDYKQLDNKSGKLKQTHSKEKNEATNKREVKSQDKFNSQQNKLVQQQNIDRSDVHKEECKKCKDQCICDWQNEDNVNFDEVEVSKIKIQRKLTGKGTNLDEISSMVLHNVLNVEQFIRNQSEFFVEQTSEVPLVHCPEKVNAQSKERDSVEQNQSPKIDQKVVEELKIPDLDSKESATNQKTQAKIQQARSQGGKKETDAELKAQKEEVDAMYFQNYGAAEVQQEMLDDKVRLEAYKRAIEQTCKGKTVLDLGCGTGILSLYALQAGAKKVIGIDNADIQGQLNGGLADFRDKFQFIKKAAENIGVEEIGEKVDVIVSEWMGYFLLYENMIDSYIYCINNFLKLNGITIPSEATIFLRAANVKMKNQEIQQQNEEQPDSFKIIVNEECKKEDVISEHSIIKELKFKRKVINPLQKGFKSKFSLNIRSEGMFNALIGSFQVKLGDFYLTTSPGMELTHWKHSIFFIDNPVQVEPEDVIEGTIHISTAENNHRNLVVKINYKVNQGHKSQDEEFTFE